MPQLIQLLQSAEKFLESKGIENSKLDAELLFAHILNCKRLDLYLKYDSEVPSAILPLLRDVVVRRGKHEPLQYIIREVEFYGLQIFVDSRVLIPRHETEQLVDIIINRFLSEKIQSILDLGTGSGAISLALAKNFPDAVVTAADISEGALAVASKNAERSGIKNIKFIKSDWFENISDMFDLIVSNPPYLRDDELESSQPEVKIFEPKLALVSGGNGLRDIEKIICSAWKYLRANGSLVLETGVAQHHKIEVLSKEHFTDFESVKDLCGRNRFVLLKANTASRSGYLK